MLDMLYDLLRSSTGLCLVVVGLGFLLEPARQRARAAFGVLYMGVGAAFLFSWVSAFVILPGPIDLALLAAIVYSLGLSVLDMNVYLFGDEAHRGARRRLAIAGLAWSLIIWLLPFIDSALGLKPVTVNVEDGRPLALFQSVAYLAVYFWPIAMAVVSLRIARYRLADLPKDSRSVRALGRVLAGTVAILAAIGLGILLSNRPLYRIGHALLELGLIGWYLYVRARPDVFSKARADIGASHRKRLELGPEEAAAIGSQLDALASGGDLLSDPELDLPGLAKAAGLPAYRLSAYFNAHRGESFSAWLNAARIDRACLLLRERPELGILDVAFEVGYGSKGTFNSQFQRRVGMTPSEYRARGLAPEAGRP